MMENKERIVIFAALLAALAGGCGGNGKEAPPEEEDLVASTAGKSDTGYMSSLATELEGEFEGELRLDVSTATPEERTALLDELTNGGWKLKDTVISQVKFSKNRLNTESLHMNLYSDVVEAGSVELVDDKVIKVPYKVRLESIVSHEELEKAGLTIEQVLQRTVTDLKLPADPRTVFTAAGEKCAEGFDAGSLADYNYFYYWKPEKEGCAIDQAVARFTVSSLAPPQETTYPEYDRLKEDNKVTVVVFFGAAGHEETVPSSDWGVTEWRDLKSTLGGRGFRKAEDLKPGERYRRVRAGVEELVDIYSPYDLHDAADKDALFKKGIAEHEVIVYNGHSFYGSLGVLKDCSVYPAGRYQIFHIGSCWSYEYYTRQIFECKKSEADPLGWDLADIVNDTEAGWFHNNEEFTRILLTNLFAGVETGGKDRSRFYTWFNIVSAMNEHAISTWKWMDTKTHEIMGVSGVRNNRYDPETAAGGGKKYLSGTSVAIPDNDPAGLESEIVVAAPVVPSRITLALDVRHPAAGELTVSLSRGAARVVLHDRAGGWADDIVREYDVTDPRLKGVNAEGSWTLKVVDSAAGNTGTLKSWSLTLVP